MGPVQGGWCERGLPATVPARDPGSAGSHPSSRHSVPSVDSLSPWAELGSQEGAGPSLP